MGILRTILIIILVYYVIKLITRMLAPIMARKMMEKAAKNFENQFNNPYYREQTETKEGEILIEKKPEEPLTPKRDLQAGEYIDFEEID